MEPNSESRLPTELNNLNMLLADLLVRTSGGTTESGSGPSLFNTSANAGQPLSFSAGLRRTFLTRGLPFRVKRYPLQFSIFDSKFVNSNANESINTGLNQDLVPSERDFHVDSLNSTPLDFTALVSFDSLGGTYFPLACEKKSE